MARDGTHSDALVHHFASLRTPGDVLRLGKALLAEVEWRCAATASGGSSRPAALPPDPGASIALRDGKRCRIAELTLPARGTAAEGWLLSSVHTICCEAATTSGRWEDAEWHARAGLVILSSVKRTEVDAREYDWVGWREMCLAHAALLASHRLADPAGVVTAAPAAAALRASHRSLLRQLQDHCARRERGGPPRPTKAPVQPSPHKLPLGIDSVLRLAVAATTCAMDAPANSASLRDDVVRTLAAALRCAHRELIPTSSITPPKASSTGPTPPVAEVAQMLDELLSTAARAMSGGADGDAEAESAGPPAKKARSAQAAINAPTCAALLRCGSAAAVLLAGGAGGETRPGSKEVLRLIGLCLPDAALSDLLALDELPHSPDLRRAVACALHVLSTCCATAALARATAEASSSAWQPDLELDGPDSAAGLLRAAERDAARAMAVRAGPRQPMEANLTALDASMPETLDVDASDGEDVAAALACRRTRAVLLLLLGRVDDAAAAHLGPAQSVNGSASPLALSPPPSAICSDDATVGGVLCACRGDAEGSLEALQHALAVGSASGRAQPLPLYNILCHYDRLQNRSAALRLADYFSGADFGGNATVGHLRSHSTAGYLAVHASTTRPAFLVLHDASVLLNPLAAQYLRARACLLAKEWAESSAALRPLLDNERALRPTLRLLGLDEGHLLRQLALAMLHNGEHHELIELLRERGALGSPLVSDLVADALFCEHEAAAALEPAAVALNAAESVGGVDESGSEGARGRVKADEVRAEVRARNNRACYLVCNERHAEAEGELLASVKIAPHMLEPSYNLALLRWQVGERRRAAEGWLQFRAWSTTATPDVYARLADNVLPGPGVAPPTPQSAVSGEVDPASAAALDRAMLRHWSALRSEEMMRQHWGGAGAGGGPA